MASRVRLILLAENPGEAPVRQIERDDNGDARVVMRRRRAVYTRWSDIKKFLAAYQLEGTKVKNWRAVLDAVQRHPVLRELVHIYAFRELRGVRLKRSLWWHKYVEFIGHTPDRVRNANGNRQRRVPQMAMYAWQPRRPRPPDPNPLPVDPRVQEAVEQLRRVANARPAVEREAPPLAPQAGWYNLEAQQAVRGAAPGIVAVDPQFPDPGFEVIQNAAFMPAAGAAEVPPPAAQPIPQRPERQPIIEPILPQGWRVVWR